MKIEVFEITSHEDKVFQELLAQYETNPELRELLDKQLISGSFVLAGDFSLIKMMSRAIEIDELIKVYW